MTQFNDRKDAFESRFAHDAELRFKAMARRNKLFGLWAANQLGQSGAEAETYAKSVRGRRKECARCRTPPHHDRTPCPRGRGDPGGAVRAGSRAHRLRMRKPCPRG
jgi:ATPase inhibitor subunit zeta